MLFSTRFVAALVGGLALLGLPACTHPPASNALEPSVAIAPRQFDSPEDAVVALVAAARDGDLEATKAIFGSEVTGLESDSAAKTEGDLQRLAAAYDRRHALFLNPAPEGTQSESVTLAVGEDLWEFPVPIVRAGEGSAARWRFDTSAGAAALQAAYVQANEAAATEFLLACIPAQQQFRELNTLPTPSFAQRFRSEPGTRNGLWWPDDLAPPFSPVGPMVDEAAAGGKLDAEAARATSYGGYRFRVLTGAGSAAPGGAANWLDANGNLVGGFAFVAWPASYGATGVRSILVAMDGTVWARDLGPESEAIVGTMTVIDPGAGWELCELVP